MAVVRIADYVEGYRLRALSPDIHRLTGRNSVAGTEFVSSQILAALNLSPSDVLVDIGCGDGCLLKLAEGRVASRIGIVPTEEEKKRLDSILPGVTIAIGLVQRLTLETESVSKVVCNGVLILLASADEVKNALKQMCRVAGPGATIWVGEVPEIDESAHFGKYRGTSVRGFLWHLLRNDGFRSFLGMCRRLLLASIGKLEIVLNSAGIFYARPEELIALAQSSGLHLRAYFKHKDLDEEGHIVESRFRYDYIFQK